MVTNWGMKHGQSVMRLVMLTCSICMTVVVPGHGADEVPVVIGRHNIESRLQITSGHVRVETVTTIRDKQGVRNVTTRKIETFFSDESIREDQVLNYSDKRDGTFRVSVSKKDGIVYRYTDETPLIIAKMTPLKDLPYPLRTLSDPRLIGIWPTDYLNLRGLNLKQILTAEHWKVFGEPSDESLGNRKCVKTTYLPIANPSTAKVDVWHDPREGQAVARVVCKFGDTEDSIECENALVPEFGWFPARVKYVRTENGTAQREEVQLITVVQLNDEIPPSTFDFTGMGIPLGKKVYDFTTDPKRVLSVGPNGLVPFED